jgi:hypothetical protein
VRPLFSSEDHSSTSLRATLLPALPQGERSVDFLHSTSWDALWESVASAPSSPEFGPDVPQETAREDDASGATTTHDAGIAAHARAEVGRDVK